MKFWLLIFQGARPRPAIQKHSKSICWVSWQWEEHWRAQMAISLEILKMSIFSKRLPKLRCQINLQPRIPRTPESPIPFSKAPQCKSDQPGPYLGLSCFFRENMSSMTSRTTIFCLVLGSSMESSSMFLSYTCHRGPMKSWQLVIGQDLIHWIQFNSRRGFTYTPFLNITFY